MKYGLLSLRCGNLSVYSRQHLGQGHGRNVLTVSIVVVFGVYSRRFRLQFFPNENMSAQEIEQDGKDTEACE